jgi:hypothetical protein
LQGVTTLNFLFSSISLRDSYPLEHMRLKFSEVIIPPVDGVVDAEFFVIADKVYKDILINIQQEYIKLAADPGVRG